MNSASKAVFSEESTWTMYFQDLWTNNNNNNNNKNHDDIDRDRDCFGYDNSSSISDAASFVGPNKIASKKTGANLRPDSKKRRTREGTGFTGGYDLEDTASSPSSSPKVHDDMVDELDSDPTQEETRIMTREERCHLSHVKQRIEIGLNWKDGDSTELKKKGLCLVPLSMLSNYID